MGWPRDVRERTLSSFSHLAEPARKDMERGARSRGSSSKVRYSEKWAQSGNGPSESPKRDGGCLFTGWKSVREDRLSGLFRGITRGHKMRG